MRRWAGRAAALLVLAALAGIWAWPWLDRAPDLRQGDAPAAPLEAGAVARGAYLATLGNCGGCHTAPGGAPFAGGRDIHTPYGPVASANLTPDRDTGIGRWTPAAFRRALRDGRSADGRPLLPACPYPWFGRLDDADADDLYAFLRSQPARHQRVSSPQLRTPYSWPQAVLAWRLLNHRTGPRPGPERPPGAGADWARGAWLVAGIAHCGACHGEHDAWGATAGPDDLRGGVIPAQGWLAPSLTDAAEGAVSGWPMDEAVALLRDGRSARATVSGPMAHVVARSTQHWRADDLRAAVGYLQSLPAPPARPRPAATAPDTATLARGKQLYADHCAGCHGADGEGHDDDGPALAGNRAVALTSPVNVVRMVLGGGFGPSTRAVPQPAGMPPYATLLSDGDVAAVVSYVRWRYGPGASGVDAVTVNRQR